MKPRYNWKEESNNIRSMSLQGLTTSEIGLKYGVTGAYIWKLIKTYNIFDNKMLYGVSVRAKIKKENKQRELFLKRGNKEDTALYKAKRAKFIIKKSNMKRAGIEFTINFGELDWPEYCPILGIRLDYFAKGQSNDNSPSFDRLDSNMGYVQGNVTIISNKANRIKNNATVDDIAKLLEWYKKQKVAS